MSKRHFYAADHTHSVRFSNDVSMITRFETKAERNEYVESEEFSRYHDFCREAITAAKARTLAPNAFRLLDEGRDMRAWVSDGYPGEFFTLYD